MEIGNIMKGDRKRPLVIVVGALVCIALCVSAYFYLVHRGSSINQLANVATSTPVFVPERTNFGTSTPTGFPTNIPIETGAKVEQSYSLGYTGQDQLTIVFLSTKSVNTNYSLYADFLKKQGWAISNKYKSAKLSSLYATKGSQDINVTISENTTTPSTKSQVSVSVLKK